MATMAMAGLEMERMRPARRGLNVAEHNREVFERQRARRRGPTPEMFFAKHIDNTRLVKSDDPQLRREMVRFTIAMALFFALTMVYVWQHFSAIEVGYSVEAQKAAVEQLRVNEAVLSDPGRIAPMASQLGMAAPEPGQVVRPEGDGSVLAQAKAPGIGTRE